MGISADAFWLHAVLAGLFQALALASLRRRRPYLAWTFQFGAGHGALLAALAAERFPLLVLAAALYVPLVVIPGHRLVGRPRAVWAIAAGLAGAILVGRFVVIWHDAGSPGRPMVGDRWSSSSPLRLMGDSVVLKPEWRRGRISDWGADLRFEWTVPGGARPFDVHLENAGPADAWKVEEGDVEILGGARSRMRLRLAFPPRGGTCRVRHLAPAGPLSILIVGGLRGDLTALEELLDEMRAEPPDGVVLLGDMIAEGDYAGLLAVRDIVDGLGSRMLYTPGPAECKDRASGFDVLFRGRTLRDRVADLAGVAAILLDTSSGTAAVDGLPSIGFQRLLGQGAGGSAVFTNGALAAPAGREDALVSDATARAEVLRRLSEWKTSWVASTTPGERFDFSHNGVRHLAIGVRDDAVDAALVTVDGDAVTQVRWHTVGLSSKGGARWRRLCAFAEEHPGHGECLALGCAALLGALLTMSRRRHGTRETTT